MELNNYKLLEIPFVSKKKYAEILGLKSKSKYSFEGVAYYLIDITNGYNIAWERAELLESEYRPTDKKMEKPTDYYTNILKKGFDRKNILNGKEGEISTANSDQLMKINTFSFNKLNTVLNIEGIVSGSNPSGAEKTKTASPILIKPEKNNNDYIRFVNAFKQIRKHNKIINNWLLMTFCKFQEIKDTFSRISLSDLISNNKKLKNWIRIINDDINDADEDDVVAYINDVTNQYTKENLEYTLALYEKNLIEKDKAISKLRRQFRINLISEANSNNYPEYLGNDMINFTDAEAAHIIDVNIIKKEENGYELSLIADPNNGLLLEPSMHKLFDDRKLTFDKDGNLLALNDEYKKWENKKLINGVWNNRRSSYMSERNKKI